MFVSFSERLIFVSSTEENHHKTLVSEQCTILSMSFVESTDQAHTRSIHILQRLCSTARQMQNAMQDDDQRTVVVCADLSSAKAFRESVLLFGGVQILVHGTTASLLAMQTRPYAQRQQGEV